MLLTKSKTKLLGKIVDYHMAQILNQFLFQKELESEKIEKKQLLIQKFICYLTSKKYKFSNRILYI